MRPLFSDAPVMPQAQVMPAQSPHSALAAALSGQRAPFTLPAPSMQIPLSALSALAPKPDTQYGNPNGQPSVGATASPDVMAQQMSSNMQIGQPGAPISPPLAPPPQPSWLDQLLARVNGTQSAPPPGVATPGAPGQSGLVSAMMQPPPYN